MAKLPKIKVKVPKALIISASERATLKKTFNADVVRVLRAHRQLPSADITNVEPIIVDMAVVDDAASAESPSTSKAARKAGKKATKNK